MASHLPIESLKTRSSILIKLVNSLFHILSSHNIASASLYWLLSLMGSRSFVERLCIIHPLIVLATSLHDNPHDLPHVFFGLLSYNII